MRTYVRAKGLVGTGGDDVLKIFFFYSPMFNTKSYHLSPQIKQYILGNRYQMQYHKKETNS